MRVGSNGRTERALVGLLLIAGALVGIVAGLSAAAGGLALAGRTLFALEPADIQLFLVVGPLAGLLPVAALAQAAGRWPWIARRASGTLLAWALGALVSLYWYGIHPLMR